MTEARNNRTLEFFEIYKKQVLPILRNYEVYRMREYKKHKIWVTAFKLLGIFYFIFLLALFGGPFEFLRIFFDKTFGFGFIMLFSIFSPMTLILGGCIYSVYINKKNKGFANTLKLDCLEKILQVFGDIKWHHKDTAEYHSGKIISDSTISNCGLFIPYNHREDDDCFYGEYKGVPFKILETNMWDEHGSGKNRRVITAHKGVIVEFETNKHTTNRTIIQTKGDVTAKQAPFVLTLCSLIGCLQYLIESRFSLFSIIFSLIIVSIFAIIEFSHFKKQEPLNKVTLEDVMFNKRFDVYSSDQTEARYMITTSFMERFYNLKTAFNAKNIKCSFIGNKLIIALQTPKNLFEIGSLFKSLESPESINDFYNELSSILKMVECFKLDEKTKL